jgi:hypothetical protein
MLNAFDNVTRVMARRGAMTRHEKILSDRSSEELCLDLARKHAGCLKWTECDTCKRLTHEFKTARRDDPAVSKKFVRRCIACERKFRTRFHYEQIVRLLYHRRPKPLSEVQRMTYAEKRNAYVNCLTQDESLLSRDLLSVVNDQSYTMHRRETASRELADLRKEIERRQEHRYGEWVAAACSSQSFQSRAERMLNKFGNIDSKKLFGKAVRRYLTAKVRNATWTAKLPLLEYLAVEWVRDPKALSRFLDAAFGRWRDLLGNPKSVRGRSIIIHQALGSQSCVERCRGRGIKPMAAIAELLIRNGAAKPEEFEQLYGALRTQKSRELRKCDPRRERAIVVTLE